MNNKTCSFENCDKIARSKKHNSFCQGHEAQQRRNKALSPLSQQRQSLIFIDKTIYIPLIDQLSNHIFATADLDDLSLIEGHNWHLNNKTGYVQTRFNQKNICLHKLLMSLPQRVDHRDRNKLNNCRSNLRYATASQSVGNTGPSKGRIFKGITASKNGERWIAKIQGKYLGTFSTQEDAAREYDKFAFDLWGDFAFLNFPDE